MPRSNEDWLRDLRATGPAQEAALEELRRYLLRALPGALRKRGEVPNDFVEDVVQEALLRTLDRLDRFEGRSRFTTWATSITARLALTELRRRRWKDVSLDEMTRGGDIELPWADRDGLDAEASASRSQVLATVKRVMEEELTDRQRTALVAELRGMPQEEIGRTLELKRNAVYKLAHDARKKLRKGLEAAGLSADEALATYR